MIGRWSQEPFESRLKKRRHRLFSLGLGLEKCLSVILTVQGDS
jgi:hypothetical protein